VLDLKDPALVVMQSLTQHLDFAVGDILPNQPFHCALQQKF
jgi:hypothetical protein